TAPFPPQHRAPSREDEIPYSALSRPHLPLGDPSDAGVLVNIGVPRLPKCGRHPLGCRPNGVLLRSAVDEVGSLVEQLRARRNELLVRGPVHGFRPKHRDLAAVLEFQPYAEVALQRAAHRAARQQAEELALLDFAWRRGVVLGELASLALEPLRRPADDVPRVGQALADA